MGNSIFCRRPATTTNTTISSNSEEYKIWLSRVERYGGWITLMNAPQYIRNNQQIILRAIQDDPTSLCHAPKKLRQNIEFALMAVQVNGLALDWVSEELKGNKYVACAAVQQDGMAMNFVSQELKFDQEFRDLLYSKLSSSS